MNPYSRFRLVTNFLAAALVAGGLCALWPAASGMLAAAAGGVTAAYWAGVGIAALLTVTGSLLLTEALLPALFQWSVLRKLVLGRDYVEGTWLQAERGPSGTERLTVMHLRAAGAGYELSAYSLNEDNEIESNRIIAWSKLDGPVLSCAYRTLMPDGAGNQAQFTSELMFEQRRGAPRSVAGFGVAAGSTRRFQIEGVKLTRWSERRRLRKLEQRGEVVAHYWNLFFGVVADMPAERLPDADRPVVVVTETRRTPFIERRDPDNVPEPGTVVARRRASDWRQEDTTPTADRIRARMMAGMAEAEEEDAFEEEDEIEDEVVYEAEADDDFEDDVLLEEDARDEDIEVDDDDAYEAEDDDVAEAEEDDFIEAETGDEDEIADEAEDEPKAEEEPRIRHRYARR